MRAVLFGLVGAVLAVGSAGAGECPEAKAVVRATYSSSDGHSFGEPARPDLKGKDFRVVRARGVSGYRLIEVSGKAGRFIIKEEASPAWATSWDAASPDAPKIDRPDPLGKIRVHDAYGLIVTDGPLSGLVMEVADCR